MKTIYECSVCYKIFQNKENAEKHEIKCKEAKQKADAYVNELNALLDKARADGFKIDVYSGCDVGQRVTAHYVDKSIIIGKPHMTISYSKFND